MIISRLGEPDERPPVMYELSAARRAALPARGTHVATGQTFERWKCGCYTELADIDGSKRIWHQCGRHASFLG